MRAFPLSVFVLALAAASAPALAEDAGLSLSGEAAIVSDYRYRGVSLSGRDPALQAGVELSHDSGLYAGVWGSTIEGGALWGDVEVDLTAGWSGDVAENLTVDAMLSYYAYPDGDAGAGPAHYWEATGKLTRSFGGVEGSAGASYAWEQAALGGDSLYLFTEAAAPIATTPLVVKAGAGYSTGALAYDGGNLDWTLGLEAEIGPVALGLAYVDTDVTGVPDARAGLVFSLAASF